MSGEALTAEENAALERLLREIEAPPPLGQRPHPSHEEIAGYVAKELDEETARCVRVHLLHCEDCFEEVLGLEASREGERFWSALVTYVRSLTEAMVVPPAPMGVRAVGVEAPRQIRARILGDDGERFLELTVRYGPILSEEGTFYLVLQLPKGAQLGGRSVAILLALGEESVEWEEEVRGDVITVSRPFGPGPREMVQERLLEAALLRALGITIQEGDVLTC